MLNTDEYQIDPSLPDDLSVFTEHCCKQGLHLHLFIHLLGKATDQSNEHKSH